MYNKYDLDEAIRIAEGKLILPVEYRHIIALYLYAKAMEDEM